MKIHLNVCLLTHWHLFRIQQNSQITYWHHCLGTGGVAFFLPYVKKSPFLLVFLLLI